MKIDIVTVYNDKILYDEMMQSAHTKGGADRFNCEFIGIDNTDGRYKSAAEAYNHAIDNLSTGDVIVFCHQDIIWLENAFDNLVEAFECDSDSLYGAAGVAPKIGETVRKLAKSDTF